MKAAYWTVAFLAMIVTCHRIAWGAEKVSSQRAALREIAADIEHILARIKGGNGAPPAVAIGAFSGSVDIAGSAGPGIQTILEEELRNTKVPVNINAYHYEISGRYDAIRHPGNPKLQVIKLTVSLTEKDTGEPLAEQPTRFVLPADVDVPAMQGAIISGPPLSTPNAISDAIDHAKTTPQFEVVGSELRGKKGRYAIEVIVKEKGAYVSRPITVEKDGPLKGRPIVDLRNAEIYGVRLINKSDIEAAVDLRIDGINCFAFSKSKATHWIVAPHSQLDILGWHRDAKAVIEFKVESKFPDTAAGKLKLIPSDAIGMITAAFSAAWTLESPPPEDESLVSRGTGFGEEIAFQSMNVQRNIGKVRDLLSLRYEKKRD
ncbi:MAG: hypothetical protein ACKO38_19630 [Planctomycetota bacterium]